MFWPLYFEFAVWHVPLFPPPSGKTEMVGLKPSSPPDPLHQRHIRIAHPFFAGRESLLEGKHLDGISRDA